MLLIELVQLIFEADLATTEIAFVHPSLRKVVTAPSGTPFHLHMIADNPQMFLGMSPDELEPEIMKHRKHGERRLKTVDNWAHAYDNVFSKYHDIAYKRGWVRWRVFKTTGIAISGTTDNVMAALSIPQVVKGIQDHPQYHSEHGVVVTVDWTEGPDGLNKYARRPIRSPLDLNRLRADIERISQQRDFRVEPGDPIW